MDKDTKIADINKAIPLNNHMSRSKYKSKREARIKPFWMKQK